MKCKVTISGSCKQMYEMECTYEVNSIEEAQNAATADFEYDPSLYTVCGGIPTIDNICVEVVEP